MRTAILLVFVFSICVKALEDFDDHLEHMMERSLLSVNPYEEVHHLLMPTSSPGHLAHQIPVSSLEDLVHKVMKKVRCSGGPAHSTCPDTVVSIINNMITR